MLLNNSPKEIQEIYDNLKEINGIKFTPRQVDILSCILHMRNYSKIAYLLGIESVRTVESHIRDIRSKLNNMATQDVIDFLEKSGKKQYLQAYYREIRIKALFEEKLKKIATLSNRGGLYYLENNQLDNFLEKSSADYLIKHLKMANIKPVDSNKLNNEGEKIIPEDKIYNLKSIDQALGESKQFRSIFLLYDETIDHEIEGHDSSVNFAHISYYLALFKIITIMLGSQFVHDIRQEFIQEAEGLNVDVLTASNVSESNLRKKSMILIGVVLLLLSVSSCSYYVYNQYAHTRAIKSHIYHILPKLFPELLISNLTSEQYDKNLSIIKKFEKVVELIRNDEIDRYFDVKDFTSDELINSIYNLNAISSYTLFREHNALKAQKILLFAKNIAEKYVTARSGLAIDFEKCSPEELYTEFLIIKHLPEMYTNTMYFLGRTYFLLDESQNAVRFLEQSAYLGEKLGIFQGVLSLRNGLLMLNFDEINAEIKASNYRKAKKLIISTIEKYNKLKNDNREYIQDYMPRKEHQETIILNQDIYHMIDCNKRVTKFYTKLINIISEPEELEKYMSDIQQHINAPNIGVVDVMKRSEKTYQRGVSDNGNQLGLLLIALYDKEIDLGFLKGGLIAAFNLKNSDDLYLIEQVFNYAKSFGRSTEFIKADSYEGLIRVYERKAKKLKNDKSQLKKLESIIDDFKTKRDEINLKLNRKKI